MGVIAPDIWLLFGVAAHGLAAVVALLTLLLFVRRRQKLGTTAIPLTAAVALTFMWTAVTAIVGLTSAIAILVDGLSELAWLGVIFSLFAGDGRHRSVAPIRPVVVALAFAALVNFLTLVVGWISSMRPEVARAVFDLSAMLRLLIAVGGLVLVHNLYLGASPQSRMSLRWPVIALGIHWAFDLNDYTITYLGTHLPIELLAARGVSIALLCGLFAIGAFHSEQGLRLRPSRAVTFQTVSLIVIGSYFLSMFTVAQWLALSGGDFSRLMAFGFLLAASVAAVFILPSRRLRGWLKVMLAKHLFQHRYDYRSEWLRFTRTIGNAADQDRPLQERVVQAVADIAESPGGLLLAPNESGELQLAARWQWSGIEAPAVIMGSNATHFFEQHAFIVDLDDLRAGKDERGEAAIVPDWLQSDPRAWALVPLIHYERLTGVVVLARPTQVRKFDWEDFDLLRVVGQQLASYLAEHASQDALAEANRFDDFNRRIAFVMHDIKNLASQLSLLARNAELHADKPAFRDDMLLTLRNSADKLNTLLARLSRYGASGVAKLEPVPAHEIVGSVVARLGKAHPVIATEVECCTALANADSLEQVLVHLIQNGIDASPPESPVFISLTVDGVTARFEIVDSGQGMSPEFIRTRLFKPFVSSKTNGFGIGAFEARELVRAMNGRIEVDSREGLGTRFIVRLPLVAASGQLSPHNEQDVA